MRMRRHVWLAGWCGLKKSRKVVLPHRIELWTSSLPMRCSTTELRQQGPEIAVGAPANIRSLPGCRAAPVALSQPWTLLRRRTYSVSSCPAIPARQSPNASAASAWPRLCVKTSSAARRRNGAASRRVNSRLSVAPRMTRIRVKKPDAGAAGRSDFCRFPHMEVVTSYAGPACRTCHRGHKSPGDEGRIGG